MTSALVSVLLLAGAGSASTPTVTRAQYDRVKRDTPYEKVVEIFGRQGVQETVAFYAWPDANVRAGFRKDGSMNGYQTLAVMKPEHQARYEAFKAAFKARLDEGKPFTYDHAVTALGGPGKKLELVEYVWRNKGGGKIAIEFEKGKSRAKGVIGRLK